MIDGCEGECLIVIAIAGKSLSLHNFKNKVALYGEMRVTGVVWQRNVCRFSLFCNYDHVRDSVLVLWLLFYGKNVGVRMRYAPSSRIGISRTLRVKTADRAVRRRRQTTDPRKIYSRMYNTECDLTACLNRAVRYHRPRDQKNASD